MRLSQSKESDSPSLASNLTYFSCILPPSTHILRPELDVSSQPCLYSARETHPHLLFHPEKRDQVPDTSTPCCRHLVLLRTLPVLLGNKRSESAANDLEELPLFLLPSFQPRLRERTWTHSFVRQWQHCSEGILRHCDKPVWKPGACL